MSMQHHRFIDFKTERRTITTLSCTLYQVTGSGETGIRREISRRFIGYRRCYHTGYLAGWC